MNKSPLTKIDILVAFTTGVCTSLFAGWFSKNYPTHAVILLNAALFGLIFNIYRDFRK